MVFTRDQIGGNVLGVSTYGNNYWAWTNPTGGAGAIRPVPGFDCNSSTNPGFWTLPNGRCSFNFNSVAANEAAVDNTSVFVRGDYQINDDWTVYMTATTTKVETFGRYAPVPGVLRVEDGTPNDINGGVMCGAACTGDGRPTNFYHRFAAAGNRDNSTDTTNSDFLVGFQGQLTDSISVDFGARRTNYQYDENGYGYIIQSLANQAIDRGDYVLTDPFGASQETLNSFTATIGRNSFFKTKEFYGNVSFDLFEMGGGISNAVVGAEYREDQFADVYDSLSQAGVVLGSSGGASGGTRDVYSAYFEWLLPFSSSFDITLAGRYDSYSDYGNDFSPKIAARWQPLDNLTLRASYGQGFRAPGLDILTQADSFSADPVVDRQTCLAAGLNEFCLNSRGRQVQQQVDTYYIANPNLKSEQSTQWSAGIVYDPVDWLDLSLDYYNIEIENSITVLGAQAVINRELAPETYGPVPDGLGVVRNATNGRVIEVTAGYRNIGTLETDGLDFRANTDFDLGNAGRLRNKLTVSYINKYDVISGNYTTEYAGEHGYPDLRANLSNEWTFGDFGVNWGINYIGDQSTAATVVGGVTIAPALQVGGYATNDLQFTWNAPWNAKIAVGATNIGDRYPELVPFDGRPWNFYLYDAYGRTVYFRYTQTF